MEDGERREDESMRAPTEEVEERKEAPWKSENQPSSQEVQEHEELTYHTAHDALSALEEGEAFYRWTKTWTQGPPHLTIGYGFSWRETLTGW